MSVIYLLALAGVGLAVVVLSVDAILAVARKPGWQEAVARPSLQAVATDERRKLALPFVGADRRRAGAAEVPEAGQVRPGRVA